MPSLKSDIYIAEGFIFSRSLGRIYLSTVSYPRILFFLITRCTFKVTKQHPSAGIFRAIMTEADRIEFLDRLSGVSNGKLAVFLFVFAGLVVEVSHFIVPSYAE